MLCTQQGLLPNATTNQHVCIMPGPPVADLSQGLSPNAITNLAWACASLGQSQPKMFAALAKSAVPQKVGGWGCSFKIWATLRYQSPVPCSVCFQVSQM